MAVKHPTHTPASPNHGQTPTPITKNNNPSTRSTIKNYSLFWSFSLENFDTNVLNSFRKVIYQN